MGGGSCTPARRSARAEISFSTEEVHDVKVIVPVAEPGARV